MQSQYDISTLEEQPVSFYRQECCFKLYLRMGLLS